MSHQHEIPPTVITNPNLANLVGYALHETGLIPIAQEAERDGRPDVAEWLQETAYRKGAMQAIEWCSELGLRLVEEGDGPEGLLVDYATNKRLIENARANPIVLTPEEPSNPLDRRIAGMVASASDSIARKNIIQMLDVNEGTTQHAVTRLANDGLVAKEGPQRGKQGVFPTPQLEALVAGGGEVALWRDIYRLGQTLGLSTERQILSYLAALGQTASTASNEYIARKYPPPEES